MKLLKCAIAAVAMVAMTAPAAAHRVHHHHGGHHKVTNPNYLQTKGKAAKVRYGGAPGRGYWRPGPKAGYGFRFATYKGDPFGSDDYWDGGRCYYNHHQNYCVKTRIFNGFWDGPTHR